jgi:protein-S-isoprenylcysteine O-methyltransferase Ste14
LTLVADTNLLAELFLPARHSSQVLLKYRRADLLETAGPVAPARPTPFNRGDQTMPSQLNERMQRWGFSWVGLRDNRHGEWWVLAQMMLIAAHWLPPTPPPSDLGIDWPLALRLVGGLTFLIGLVFGTQGALNLGDSLSPLPEPIPGAPLITEGAYARCRHPLYQSLLLCSLGVSLALGSLLHLGLLLALATLLSLKARREERRLCSRHSRYADYMTSTPAIVPFLPGLDWRVAPETDTATTKQAAP